MNAAASTTLSTEALSTETVPAPDAPLTFVNEPSGSGLAYALLNRQTVRKGFLSIEQLTLRQRKADGSWCAPFRREVIERGHAVAVVLHDPRLDRLLFVRQLRVGGLLNDRPFMLELVAGMIDRVTVDGRSTMEDPEISVRRESEEEAHVSVGELTRIGAFIMSAGGSSETTTVYYAEADLSEPSPWGGCPDENEVIQIVTMDVDEAMKALDQGLFNSGSTGIGLYWLRAERAMGRCLGSRGA